MPFLTIDEVKQELGIDFDDEATNARLKRYIGLAKEYLDGAIDIYYSDDKRAKELALLIIEDLYERKSYSVKENSSIKKLKESILMQLQWGVSNDNL